MPPLGSKADGSRPTRGRVNLPMWGELERTQKKVERWGDPHGGVWRREKFEKGFGTFAEDTLAVILGERVVRSLGGKGASLACSGGCRAFRIAPCDCPQRWLNLTKGLYWFGHKVRARGMGGVGWRMRGWDGNGMGMI